MKKFLLFTLVALLGFAPVRAQVTTSSLSGTILDSKGEELIGASVKATHQPTGSTYGVSSNAQGKFSIPNMRVGGPYLITVSYIGFQSRNFSGVMLKLGEPYVLNVVLSNSGNELSEVVVSVGTSTLNGNRTGAATNVSTQQLNTLPTITRSLEDFTRLTPQANGVGFAGRDGRYNNVQIDGANLNNAFGLSSSDLMPGGAARPVSLDAIEELQVNIAPFDVRQSGFTGAGINAVTRSGTNNFSGSAYTFYRNQGLRGTKIGSVELDNPDNYSHTYGVRVGGPIIKNKLFFFANYEHEKEQFPGVNWIASREGATGNVARTTATDLERVRTHLINTYGYDPGAYENYANKFANETDRFLARLDWNINDKHKFSLKYNYSEGTSDQTVNASSGPNPRSSSGRISANSLVFANSNYAFLNKVSALTAELNSALAPGLSNQLLLTYSNSQATRSYPGGPFPFVDIFQGGNNYMSFGTELFSGANDLINDNYSVINNVTYETGKHTLTGGFSYEQIEYGNLYQRLGTSYYRYNSVDDFINNAQPSVYGLTYTYPGQDPYVSVKFGVAGLYAQDRISVNDRFDVTLGLRADMPLYLNDLQTNPNIDNLELLDQNGNPTTYRSGSWPKSRVMLSPRVGFNYDVFGDRSLTLRGGTGIFAGRVPFVWLTNMPGGTGLIQNTLEPVNSAALPGIRFNPDPLYWLENGDPKYFLRQPSDGIPSSIALVDRNFKMPKVWRTSIGADYAIPGTPLVASADLMYTKDINGIFQFNANRKAATAKMNYSGDNRDFWVNKNNAFYTNQTGITPVLANTDKGHSYTATFGLSLPSLKGFSGSVYYTHTGAKDITGNPGSSASSAWSNNYSVNDPNEQLLGISQFALPHRVIANISYRKEYLKNLGTTVSLFYEGANQGRFAYTTGGDLNLDGVTLDLLYIPQDAQELNFAPIAATSKSPAFSVEQQRAAYEEFVSNSKVLKNSKGDYVERNNGLMPWLNRFDFRLLQDIFTNVGGRRNTLQLSMDIQNLGNLFNSEWGVSDQLNGGSSFNYSLLNVASVSPAGVPTFNMITVTENGETFLPTTPFRKFKTLSSTWRMQLGVRYIF